MSLDEEDIKVRMPDFPEFSSSEQNVLSLVGRLLNPERQKMSSLILDMPRKWQKVGKVRGVALTKEKFQFIFNTEYDLLEVLEKGIQSYNEWSLAIERWIEDPPPNFLQTVPLWVQIKNIPLNYYTEKAITFLGELVGQVTEVAFDPHRAQSKDYVRVKIMFDVAKPLIRKRTVTLPKGNKEIISYFYEKVQKRCYNCQRLTHEMTVCPVLVKQRQMLYENKKEGVPKYAACEEKILKESDPLYGVLSERQVGVNPITGRPRIAEEVLEGMRQYLLVSAGEERRIREERVKKSIKEVENDPILEKTVLRLEPQPLITTNLNKGKGIVFGYDTEDSASQSEGKEDKGPKLLGEAIKASIQNEICSPAMDSSNPSFNRKLLECLGFAQNISTVQRTQPLGVGSSGNAASKLKPRRRPSKKKRKLGATDTLLLNELLKSDESFEINSLDNRKKDEKRNERANVSQLQIKKSAVPNEGSSSIQ